MIAAKCNKVSLFDGTIRPRSRSASAGRQQAELFRVLRKRCLTCKLIVHSYCLVIENGNSSRSVKVELCNYAAVEAAFRRLQIAVDCDGPRAFIHNPISDSRFKAAKKEKDQCNSLTPIVCRA